MSPLVSGIFGFLAALFIGLLIMGLLVWRGSRQVTEVDPQTLIDPLPSPATMGRNHAGDLFISWGPEIKVTEVKIEAAGHKPLSIAYPKHNRLEVSRPDVPRPMATLSVLQTDETTRPLVIGERFLPLKKGLNVRDIGGYETIDGRQVRWGQVFRAGDLSRLSRRDQTYLQSLGLQLVCDLRTSREVAERADVLPAGILYRHLPVNEGDGPTRDYFQSFFIHRGQPHAIMRNIYLRMVRERAAVFAEWLALLADPNNLPHLVHCSAGKDRTGVSIALLLALLGVPKATIFADYTQSNRAFDQLFAAFQANQRNLRRWGIPIDGFKAVLMAHPDWLETAWKYIDQQFGSAENFLAVEGGLPRPTMAKIRRNLLVQ